MKVKVFITYEQDSILFNPSTLKALTWKYFLNLSVLWTYWYVDIKDYIFYSNCIYFILTLIWKKSLFIGKI